MKTMMPVSVGLADGVFMFTSLRIPQSLLALAAVLFVTSSLVAQGVNVSVSGSPRAGGTLTVTVSGVSAAAISVDINGVPLHPEYYGPRIMRSNGKIEQIISLPTSANSGSVNITVTTPAGIVTASVPITASDG
ncbi:MAG: hypothetical protein EXS14_04960 [Planctomycetes bacterium]|nr:hypothetical protein [Planctomycetota bacterium]